MELSFHFLQYNVIKYFVSSGSLTMQRAKVQSGAGRQLVIAALPVTADIFPSKTLLKNVRR
jgi:hypothetical protein